MADRETWKFEYSEVCKSFHYISDFRGKLLGLLPLASATGIGALLSDGIGTFARSHLMAIALFGLVVTLGLFFYELRNIELCKVLIKRGKWLRDWSCKVVNSVNVRLRLRVLSVQKVQARLSI